MPSGQRKIDNKSDGQILVVKATIDDNRQDSYDKMKTY